MELVTLSPQSIPEALALSTLAGWNQTAADWLAVINHSPETCIAIRCDGHIVATTTLVCYEKRLAWIGMVLTRPEYRRRGLARKLVEQAVKMAQARDISTIKLDATDFGRPLYQALGFRDEQPVERWGADIETREEYDPARTDPCVEPHGYLLHRPGLRAHYLGPCVADDAATAERLFRRAIGEIACEHYYWDLLPANSHAVELAQRLDFAPLRKLMRMVLGPDPDRDSRGAESRIYAIAGFEWG